MSIFRRFLAGTRDQSEKDPRKNHKCSCEEKESRHRPDKYKVDYSADFIVLLHGDKGIDSLLAKWLYDMFVVLKAHQKKYEAEKKEHTPT